MKRWLVKTVPLSNVIRLPDDAVVLDYHVGDDEGDESGLTYMVLMVDDEIIARLSDEQKLLRQKCVDAISDWHPDGHYMIQSAESMLDSMDELVLTREPEMADYHMAIQFVEHVKGYKLPSGRVADV